MEQSNQKEKCFFCDGEGEYCFPEASSTDGSDGWYTCDMCNGTGEKPKMKGEMMEHRCGEVRKALVRLNDALCSWERATSVESVLIIREQGGFVHRSVSGKPLPDEVCEDITDANMFKNIIGHRNKGLTEG